jgi:hypothetical protein
MQGSIVDSAADHGHYCNTTKCWSAGWRECIRPELRHQVYAGAKPNTLSSFPSCQFSQVQLTQNVFKSVANSSKETPSGKEAQPISATYKHSTAPTKINQAPAHCARIFNYMLLVLMTPQTPSVRPF